MFECAITLTVQPGRLDECIALLRESVVPILKAQPGLLSLALVPQEAASQLSLLSIWKSLAHAQAVEFHPGYRRAIQRLDALTVSKDKAPARSEN